MTPATERDVSQDDVVDRHALTPQQLGLLYDVLSEPGDKLFVERVVCPLHGPLDTTAFVRAWRALVARHDNLRSGFVWDASGTALQVVHRTASLEVHFSDWSGVDVADRAALCEALLAAEGAVGFELSRPPLMRLTLVRLAPDEHLLVWSSHHLILDGWSCWVLLCEAALLYLADQHALELELPPGPRFGAYARWLEGQAHPADERAYWRAYFDGCASVPPKPATHPGARRFEHEHASLSEPLTRAVTTRARETRVGLNTLLQAAWALVLAERQGPEAVEVVFGTVFSGRSAPFPGIADLVGMLITVLPVRVPLPRSEAPAVWLESLQQRHADMLAHEICTVHQVRRWLGDTGRGPHFDSVLVVMNVDPLDRLPPLGFGIGRPRYLANAGYPLGVNVTPGPCMAVELLYDLRYFTKHAVHELQELFTLALAGLSEGRDASVGALRDRLHAARREQFGQRRKAALGKLEDWRGSSARES